MSWLQMSEIIVAASLAYEPPDQRFPAWMRAKAMSSSASVADPPDAEQLPPPAGMHQLISVPSDRWAFS